MEETRQPLTAYYINDTAGKLVLTKEGIKISRKGIIVTSFASTENKKAYRLRLWEMAGQSGSCNISLPVFQFTKATMVNLRDEPLPNKKVLNIKNNMLTIDIGANEPMTLILE